MHCSIDLIQSHNEPLIKLKLTTLARTQLNIDFSLKGAVYFNLYLGDKENNYIYPSLEERRKKGQTYKT